MMREPFPTEATPAVLGATGVTPGCTWEPQIQERPVLQSESAHSPGLPGRALQDRTL